MQREQKHNDRNASDSTTSQPIETAARTEQFVVILARNHRKLSPNHAKSLIGGGSTSARRTGSMEQPTTGIHKLLSRARSHRDSRGNIGQFHHSRAREDSGY